MTLLYAPMFILNILRKHFEFLFSLSAKNNRIWKRCYELRGHSKKRYLPGNNVGICVSDVRIRQSTFFGVDVSINLCGFNNCRNFKRQKQEIEFLNEMVHWKMPIACCNMLLLLHNDNLFEQIRRTAVGVSYPIRSFIRLKCRTYKTLVHQFFRIKCNWTKFEPRVRGQCRRSADVGHFLECGRDDPVARSDAESGTDRRDVEPAENVFLLADIWGLGVWVMKMKKLSNQLE